MAKLTFKNLPTEKRERVLAAAAQLFAKKGFSRTDVAQIAAKARVAKGSIYNYFASKEEIYRDVCTDGLEKSRRAVYGGIEPGWNVYEQVEHIFRRGADFARAHPEYILMYVNVSSSGMEEFAREISREVEAYTANHLKRLLGQGVERGIVRRDADVNMAAFTINGLYILFLLSLVSEHFRIRLKEYLEVEGELDDTVIDDVVARIFEVVRAFLEPRE
ncbi:MAG: TetR/AcrR family transcriptional regulator [Desulfatibacillaceae bacterium]